MTRTLADMTPAECVGMWCEDLDGHFVILEHIHESRADGTVTVDALHPPSRDRLCYLAPELTPRFDLPRAWTPSGEPVPGEWEESPTAEHFHRWCARWEKKPDPMSRRPARGYYRVQWSGRYWDVWRTERHPRGVGLIGGWLSLDLAADAARRYLAVDRREGVLL